ncbi:hypothetical protein ACFXA4_03930 [Streptomyces sp. NPDC059442]|uniref:hypothetical protein n=1 Tax=Streptomyces sp. NPDC059442 TaxID=3346830 RepID=UPI0036A59F91
MAQGSDDGLRLATPLWARILRLPDVPRLARAGGGTATVRPHAACHCRSERCDAHTDHKTHYAGAVVILRHDL